MSIFFPLSAFYRKAPRYFAILGFSCLTISHAYAAQPVRNGSFETGDLTGWTSASINNGRVNVVQRGSCFSTFDTTAINIRGNSAAILRGNSNGDKDSIAVLRSSAFTAGDGFGFIAISATTDANKGKEPTRLVVEVLDASDDSVIVSQTFSTGQAKLNSGCPSQGVAGHFSPHYFSTREFVGQDIRIQFKQNTRIKGSPFFTLLDQVIMFNQGEQPAFRSRPHAQAGMEITSFGIPMLTSKGSFDPDHKLFDLAHTWYVEDDVFELRNPCIADIENGNHDAILYVNDGHHALSDSVTFFVNLLDNPIAAANSTTGVTNTINGVSSGTVASTNPINGTTTGATATVGSAELTDQNSPSTTTSQNIVVSDPECDVAVPGLDGNSQDVPVNDPDNLFVNTAEETVVDNLTTPTEERNGDSTATALIRASFDLQSSGIVFKPSSEGDGNLVILTPSDLARQNVSLVSSGDGIIETAEFVGRTNGDRATYRFNRPGSAYNRNIVLRVGSTDYLIQNPALRVN